MMTPEELIKNASLSNIEVTNEQAVVFTEIAFTAVNMARMEAEKSPWISVEDRLPDTDNGQSLYEVLVKMNDGRCYVAVNICVEDMAERGEVTHWMLIPE